MSGRVKEGDDGTISFADGGWDVLHCCVCSCAVGRADPLDREWGWHNGAPIHEGECRVRREPETGDERDG